MIYAKCIEESQIANSVSEFQKRQNEKNHVYCIGQITVSKNGYDILYCVPINFIYDCLKYGRYIAIIDKDDDSLEYPRKSSYMGLERCTSEQLVINIMDSQNEQTIDYIFNEVGDAELVHDGYVHTLPENIQKYFRQKQASCSCNG
ncbi:hypothetical protein [Lacrimispora xylanisolvens]|uniref:hypothetical protein n=1 Tax=Lacrimispora xylanisolvens TaxID=384636 RepID=UPI002402C5B1